MKFVLVTGGVISGLGKGVCMASIGVLLQRMGLSVSCIKMDPYLNYDTTNLSPEEHGENFVLDDGTEVDLDFGTYERFLNVDLNKHDSITAGKIYREVLDDERNQKYLGKTVQVIPHVTDAIQNAILVAAARHAADVCCIELGGTCGDIESMAFLEALRQLKKKHLVCTVHLTWIVELDNEHKTKPSQHSVMELRKAGLEPDIVVARSKTRISEGCRGKLEMMIGTPVINLENCLSIDLVPEMLGSKRTHILVADKFGMEVPAITFKSEEPEIPMERSIKICLVGKYDHDDAYLSLTCALIHAGRACGANVVFVPSVEEADGIVVPGGFGRRYLEEKIDAARYARENVKPFVGICLGLQVIVIEHARNVLGLASATSEEFDPCTSHPVVKKLESDEMRSGAQTIVFHRRHEKMIYPATEIWERHRHRYYVPAGEVHDDFDVIGTDESDEIAEIVSLKKHPFYVGTQSHPEFTSRTRKPNPLFVAFVQSCM